MSLPFLAASLVIILRALLGTVGKDNFQFFRRLASVLLQCSLSQLSVDQNFVKFAQPNW